MQTELQESDQTDIIEFYKMWKIQTVPQLIPLCIMQARSWL